jgi:hypothetical protein
MQSFGFHTDSLSILHPPDGDIEIPLVLHIRQRESRRLFPVVRRISLPPVRVDGGARQTGVKWKEGGFPAAVFVACPPETTRKRYCDSAFRWRLVRR